jgi:hypothetical protein
MNNDIQKFIKNPKRTFKIFKLNNKIIKKHINNININISNNFNFYGNPLILNNQIENNKLISYFKNLDINNNLDDCIIIAKYIIDLTIEICNNVKNNCWLTIRATVKNNMFDIPRWHYDGNFYKTDNYLTYKFVTVLRGPGTLLGDLRKKDRIEMREKYYDILDKYNNNDIKINDNIDLIIRKKIEKLLKNKKIRQIKNNEGCCFITTCKDETLRAFHSEPKMIENRIFLSILPGTKDEIEYKKNIDN